MTIAASVGVVRGATWVCPCLITIVSLQEKQICETGRWNSLQKSGVSSCCRPTNQRYFPFVESKVQSSELQKFSASGVTELTWAFVLIFCTLPCKQVHVSSCVAWPHDIPRQSLEAKYLPYITVLINWIYGKTFLEKIAVAHMVNKFYTNFGIQG